MCSGWPADWNKQRALLCLFGHALSSPNLSVNCVDLFVYFPLRNLRICCTKMTSGLQHWANIDLTFSVTLCQYFQSIHMHVLLHWINQDCVQNWCPLFIWRYRIVHAHKAPTWTQMNVLNKKLNPYQAKSMYPRSAGSEQLQFRKLFRSSSVLSSSPHPLAPWPITTRAPGIGSGRSLFPSCSKPANRKSKVLWVVFETQPSPLGCTIGW